MTIDSTNVPGSRHSTLPIRCNSNVRRRGSDRSFQLVRLLLFATLLPGASSSSSSSVVHRQSRKLDLPENVPAGTCVHNFTTPAGGPLPVTALCSLTATADLVTDNDQHCLRVGRTGLDYETTRDYQLHVICGDTYAFDVIVDVSDVNDNRPRFAETTVNVTVRENLPAGTHIMTVEAHDADDGSNGLTGYTLAFKGTANDDDNAHKIDKFFALDYSLKYSKKAKLITTRKLDRENRTSHDLVVFAVDGGGKTGVMRVHVSIGDANDVAPKLSKRQFSIAVAEDTTLFSQVYQVEAFDPDDGGNESLTFSLLSKDKAFSSSASEHMLFAISPGGIISTNYYPLPTGQHDFWVKVTDGVSEDIAPLVVDVYDINDHKPKVKRLCKQSRLTFEEPGSYYLGKTICRFAVSDNDRGSNAEVNVTLFHGDDVFELADGPITHRPSPFTVSVVLAKPLDFEKKRVYHLVLMVVDNGSPPHISTKELTVHVLDHNEFWPQFEGGKTLQLALSEAAPPSELITRIDATDADGSDNAIRFSIPSTIPTYAESWFSIDTHTGLLKTTAKAELDREVMSNILVGVEASNFGRRSQQPYELLTYLTVNISLIDENDHAPEFFDTAYEATILESATEGTFVVQLEVEDYDQGSNSEIDLTLSPAHQARFFEIDSEGVIWVAKGAQFDREDVGHFELIAVATDRGKPPLSSTVPVSITLLDINDNKPRFYPQTYRHQLSKTTTTDSHITTVTATDSDDEAAGTVHYKITGGNDKKFFKIDKSSGSVSFSKQAKIGYYELTVQANDGYGLTAEEPALVLISILDNDHISLTMVAQTYEIIVNENVTLNTTVATVRARPSTENAISFFIAAGDANNEFEIDSESGDLRVVAPLNRETTEQYAIEIDVVEDTSPPVFSRALVNVTIADINDNPPTFERSSIHIDMSECIPLDGTPIHTVRSIDPDADNAGTVTYHLHHPGDTMFTMDMHKGDLVPRILPDFETTKQVRLTVTAKDGGIPPLQGELEILVNIVVSLFGYLNINENFRV